MILIGANLKTSSSYPSFSGNDKKNITENTEKNNEKKNQIFSSDMANAIKSQIGIQSPIAYSFLGQYKIDNAGTVSLYKLANGQRVAILPKKGPTVIKSYFNVGSMNEPDDIRGVSHFVEHMAFNGTKNLGAGEFFKITNDMGAMTNASTSFSVTDYYISSQLLDKNDLEESIRIQSEMLQNPKYAPEMIEKEKGPVTSEISMVADSPENVALNNCIKNLFQIETSSPDLVAGRISNIQNMTRDKAYEYYNTWYTPDNCVTVITGEVAPQKAIDLIAKYFNSTKKGTPQLRKYEEFNPITQPVRKDVRMQNAQSTTVAIGLKGPVNASNKEYITMQLLLLCLLGNKTSRISTQLDKIQTAATFSVERMGNRPQDPKAIYMAFTMKGPLHRDEYMPKDLGVPGPGAYNIRYENNLPRWSIGDKSRGNQSARRNRSVESRGSQSARRDRSVESRGSQSARRMRDDESRGSQSSRRQAPISPRTSRSGKSPRSLASSRREKAQLVEDNDY